MGWSDSRLVWACGERSDRAQRDSLGPGHESASVMERFLCRYPAFLYSINSNLANGRHSWSEWLEPAPGRSIVAGTCAGSRPFNGTAGLGSRAVWPLHDDEYAG